MADVVVGPDMGGVMPSGKAVPSLDQIAAGREARRDATAFALPLPLFKNLELATACILLLPVQHARRGRRRARPFTCTAAPPILCSARCQLRCQSARRGRLAD